MAADRRERGRSPASRLVVWAVLTAAMLCVAGVAGGVIMSHTAAGRGLALDWLLGRLGPAVNGSLTVGSISPGGLLGGATFHDVRIADNRGHTVLAVDSVRASYSLAGFLGGPVELGDVVLWSPVVDLAPADGRRIRLDSLLVPGGDGLAGAAAVDSAFAGEGGGIVIRGGRIHSGTVLTYDANGSVQRIRRIEGRLGPIEVAPDPEPMLVARVDDLDLSYPLGIGVLELRDIRGSLSAREPTVAMDVEHFELPASEGRGSVEMEWSVEGWSVVFDLAVDRMALTDLAWIDERFDRGTASGEVRIATDPTGSRIEFAACEAALGSAQLGWSGAFIVGDTVRFDALTVAGERLPATEVNRWLPEPLGVTGLLSGEVRLDGAPGRLSATGDLALGSEEGATLATLSGRGTLLGRGAVADVSLNAAELDYGLLALVAPQVPWTGSGNMTVHLDGDLRTGMAVELASNLSAPDGGTSSVSVRGTVYGDTAISLVDLEARLEPLVLATVHDMYPDLPLPELSDAVSGTVSLSGGLDELEFASDLRAAAGLLTAEGRINARDPAAGYRIEASVEEFLLSEFVDGLPEPFRLSASATLNGRGLDLESVRAGLVLKVGPSTVGPLDVDSASVEAWVDEDGLLRVESLRAEAGGIGVRGAGTLGTVSAAGDGVSLAVSSPSIHPMRDLFMGENLLAWDELLPIEQDIMIEFDGVDPDTFPRARDIRFDGTVDGEVRIEGSVRDLVAHSEIAFTELEYGRYLARSLQTALTVDGLGLPAPGMGASLPSGPVTVTGTVRGDSVSVLEREYRSALLEGHFVPGGGGRLRTFIARSGTESYELQGVVDLHEQGGRIDLDRFTVVSDDRRWNLRGPARVEWRPEAVVVSDFGLIRPGTEGLRVRADGRLSRGPGDSDFGLVVTDLDLGVVGGLLQMGSLPTGVVSADLRAAGPGSDPRWAGTIDASDVELGTLSFDSLSADGSYSDRELATRLEAWGGGRRNLRAEGTIPLDLRLVQLANRIPDEPVDLRVEADSFPAAMILGALGGLDAPGGTVTGDVRLRGRPSRLEPDGSFHLRDGRGTVAAFGTRLSSAVVDLDLDPSGVVTVDGAAASGGGTVEVRGTVDLAGVQDDIGLELAFWPREFRIVDRADIEAAVTGDSVVLTNTFKYPLILGAVEVVDATVFVEEFQRAAEIVDLYDPVLFTAATVQLGLRDGADGREAAGERIPFVQNLRLIVDLGLGRGNRLTSRRMNVEMSGDLSLTFDRAGNQLIISGEADIVRGTYNFSSRTLRMTEGVLQFPGTPGFDPGISVTAVTRLPACDGEPQEITTNLSGTLLNPYLSIQSDAERATSESELYGRLLLGQCSSTLPGAGGTSSVLAGRDLVLGQVGNVLVTELRQELDLDYLWLSRPDYGLATTSLGSASLQVEFGRYLQDDVFLTGVYRRGYCADPTVPVSSGGMRVEVALPRDVKLESFLEGRCTREQYRGLDDISLQLARIWGFSFFREWGY